MLQTKEQDISLKTDSNEIHIFDLPDRELEITII